jgi:hypothetical protein
MAFISIIGMTGWVNPYSRLPGALGPSLSHGGGLRAPFFIGKLGQVRDLFWLIRHAMGTFDLLIPSLHMHCEQHVGPHPTSLLPGAISLAETVLRPFQ